ncbi:MAG: LCP family protein [Firmicutes bacterium]|nr:LCP family protein [Bacillota bacterium]
MDLAQGPHPPGEQTQERKGRAKIFKIVLLAVILVLAITGSLAYRYWWSDAAVLGDESINIVFIGVDTPFWRSAEAETDTKSYPAAFEHFGYQADALVVGTVHPIKKTINFIPLPASLKAQMSDSDMGPLGDVFAAGGVPALQKALSKLLNVPIHHYVLVDYGGFTQLVDSVGGVELSVQEPIRYYDNGQLVFELTEGIHRLNGAEALKYVRYRPGAQAEIRRLVRQMGFLSALGEQILEQTSIFKLPQLIRLTDELVETDLPWETALKIAGLVFRQKQDALDVVLLPMEEVDTDCVPDCEAVREFVDKIFYNSTEVK